MPHPNSAMYRARLVVADRSEGSIEAGVLSNEAIAPRFPFQYYLAILSGDLHAELRNGLRSVDTQDFDKSGDRVSDEYRRREVPVLTQKHRSRSRQVHGDEGVQQPSGESALYHRALEGGRGDKSVVEVQRIVIAGNLGVPGNMIRRECNGPRRPLPNREIEGSHGLSVAPRNPRRQASPGRPDE